MVSSRSERVYQLTTNGTPSQRSRQIESIRFQFIARPDLCSFARYSSNCHNNLLAVSHGLVFHLWPRHLCHWIPHTQFRRPGRQQQKKTPQIEICRVVGHSKNALVFLVRSLFEFVEAVDAVTRSGPLLAVEYLFSCFSLHKIRVHYFRSICMTPGQCFGCSISILL